MSLMEAPAADKQRFTFDEITKLNHRQEVLRKENSDFVKKHPELRNVLADFTAAVLFHKPDDVYRFAFEHFCVFATGKTAEMIRPKLIHTASHRISGIDMDLQVHECFDRNRWLVLTAQECGNDKKRVSEFSEAELCGSLGVTPESLVVSVATALCCRLKLSPEDTIFIGLRGVGRAGMWDAISPSVAECNAALRLQSVQRGRDARAYFKMKQLKHRSATRIETQWRSRKARQRVTKVRRDNAAATSIQAQFRGRRARASIMQRLEDEESAMEHLQRKR